MLVDAVVYLSPVLFDTLDADSGGALDQLAAAASLSGVIGPVVGMPDIHSGFGLPIGGVMAMDAETGLVSAGAVGMDINCGVRLLRADMTASEVGEARLRDLLREIAERVPAGVGKKTRHPELRAIAKADKASRKALDKILTGGVGAVGELGLARPEDLHFIEEEGCLAGADPDALSPKAIERTDQLGTLGGGNHFIDIGFVERVYDPEAARVFGLLEGMLTVLIHTGSRGLGHQVCTDYTEIMAGAAKKHGLSLPSKGLAASPIASEEGRRYLAAMACAANFAFVNRQVIAADVAEAFRAVFGPGEGGKLHPVYDVAHNIAKFEIHGGRRTLVHRKGATRALPAGHSANPAAFMQTGHPALIPGSMGTGSYVVIGTAATAETFFSVNHGAGRTLSRSAARRQVTRDEFIQSMTGIIYTAADYRDLLDEAPSAYKDIDAVIDTLADIGLTRRVAKLKPLAVLKGAGDE